MGFSPVQAALLIVPQPLAAMSTKMVVPHLLRRFGYRRVLLANTLAMGAAIAAFATVGPGTPVWRILVQGFVFGFCSSVQYSSMNTLVYADVGPADTSMASTLQQLSMSFGVAVASLVAAWIIPGGLTASASDMVRGVHMAFLALGMLTVSSSLVFLRLRADDGRSVSGEAGP